MEIGREEVMSVEAREAILVDGMPTALVGLHDILGLPPQPEEEPEEEKQPVVVIGAIDGKAATPEALARRVERFWLPDEPVLYIGKATSLSGRISQYYTTALGARSPHAGGWFLKLLSMVDEIYVHYVTSQEPEQTEHAMLEGFCAGVSAATRAALHDPDHPFPFANLEWPRGTRKKHGFSIGKPVESASDAARHRCRSSGRSDSDPHRAHQAALPARTHTPPDRAARDGNARTV